MPRVRPVAARRRHRPVPPRAAATRRCAANSRPDGELIVGYVGRLAPEKQVELLAGAVRAARRAGRRRRATGRASRRCASALPGAVFLGRRTGDELARIFASLDVFVHTGPLRDLLPDRAGGHGQRRAGGRARRRRPAGPGRPRRAPGCWCPPRDAAAVRDAVSVAGRRPRAAGRATGAAGRATVEGRTWAAVGDQLIGHYAEVLSRADGGGGMSRGATSRRPGCAIVRLANFVTPASGGLRTALRELGAGYRAAGHEPVLVVPGERRRPTSTTEQGRVITLPGPVLPGTGGYRVLTDQRRRRPASWTALRARPAGGLRPHHPALDRARGRGAPGVPAVMVSHETADGVLRTWGAARAACARRAADAPQRPYGARLRAGRVHHGVGGARVRPHRRPQRRTRPARRRPGALPPRAAATRRCARATRARTRCCS